MKLNNRPSFMAGSLNNLVACADILHYITYGA